jgi:hypothetical protein
MSKKNIPTNQKTITDCIGTYKRALETEFVVYFVNFNEGDENGQVKMYRKEEDHLELVSDNYFALVGLEEDIKDGSETWTSPQMKKELKLRTEEFILPLVKEYVELSTKGDLGERFNELEQEIDEYHVTLPDMDVCAFLQHKFSL